MPDREKVVRKLQDALEDAEEDGKIIAEIRRSVLFDAISLLKEQEAVEPVCKILFDIPYYFCGQCNEMLNMYSTKAMFCSKCGHPVKWGAVKG